MNNLEKAEFWEFSIQEAQDKLSLALSMRDMSISRAFEDGYRQKEIANALGLSEQRVKHIIGEVKKQQEI